MKELVLDVLAERYASTAMVAIWSPRNKVRLLRTLWVAALDIFAELGKDIPLEARDAYRRNIDTIDLEEIARLEKKYRHDVLANVNAFNALAGYEYAHRVFTSRDETDNIEQLQILQSLNHLRDRAIAILARFKDSAEHYAHLDMSGRSHLVPAQTVTLGKRFVNLAEEFLRAFGRLEALIETYPLRGVKGPMGTQQDLLEYLGKEGLVAVFEQRICDHLGFKEKFTSVGQVYPRSLDFEVLSVVAQLSSAPGNLAKMVRLMAGLELAHEGFGEEQRGSSAMPHKVNSRTCERINGFVGVIGGYLEMITHLLGDQWFEGDVSCSVVRRIALPGAFMALDGQFEATLTVLNEMQVFERSVERELYKYLPFLSTTSILTALQKHGMGRETAHTLIRKHSLAAVADLREGVEPQLLVRLCDDPDCPLDISDLEALVSKPNHGLAREQIDAVCLKIETALRTYPARLVGYTPEPIR